MNRDKQKKLIEDFPGLYINTSKDMTESCMSWGFEVGDGWFDLIYNLSLKLQEEINKEPEEDRHWFRASQVKEKFGTLRFYMDNTTNAIEDLISQAEDDSENICEQCGEPGKMRGDRWYYVACEKHNREKE